MKRRAAIAALLLAQASGLAAMSSLVRVASAQEPYPSRPIKLLAGFAAGGGTDMVARFYAQKLSARLNVPVVVENRTGAGGNIAIQSLIKMPADGYTLAMGGSYVAINAAFKRNPYDWRQDITPVAVAGMTTNLVTVAPDSKIKSIKDLIEEGRTRSAPLTFGSPGVGSASHVAGELFKAMTGARMTHVAYRGVAPAEMDLMAGNIDVLFGSITTSARLVEGGKVRALASTGPQRVSTFPDMPTVAESGVPGYTALTSLILMARSGTPDPIIASLNDAMSQIAKDPDTLKFLRGIHTEAMPGKPELARKVLADEEEKLAQLLKVVDIKFE